MFLDMQVKDVVKIRIKHDDWYECIKGSFDFDSHGAKWTLIDGQVMECDRGSLEAVIHGKDET